MPPQTRSSGKRATRSSVKKAQTTSTQSTTAPRTKPAAKRATTKSSGREIESRPRKRIRPTSPEPELVMAPPKRVRGKQGKLRDLMNMPIDVFAAIAVYLDPIDLVFFARANKFFRQILMSRSFISVWQAAERNIEGLPPCPKNLCEPQYAALVFTKYCSMCGESALRPMDPVLQVRLCVKCREKHAVETSRVTEPSLVFTSRTLVPGKHSYWSSWCLYDDARATKVKLNELAANDKAEEKAKWWEERSQVVKQRVQDAQPLIQFLKTVENEHDAELSGVRKQREAEIRSRLAKLGWEERDIDYWDRNWRRQWKSSACIAKPLTERDWELNVLPALTTYLDENKSRRLERERQLRWSKRMDRLRNWLDSIESHLAPFSQALDANTADDAPVGENSATSPDSIGLQLLSGPNKETKLPDARVLKMALPWWNEIMQWPSYKTLLETEMTAEELDLALQESRSAFDTHVLGWIKELEKSLIDLLPEQPVSTEEDPQNHSNVLLVEQPIVELLGQDLAISIGPGKLPLSSLPEDIRRLLRADVVFTHWSAPVYYPDDFHGTRFDRKNVSYNPQAGKIAQALLASLGRPNATYLEMKAAGAVFACGRCAIAKRMTWKELIRHYMDETNTNATAQKHARVRSSAVRYVFMHDIDQVIPGRPLLKAPRDTLELYNRRRCMLCSSIGLNFWQDKQVTLDHVRHVHEIDTPEEHKHYR